jgi:hypothetical protein
VPERNFYYLFAALATTEYMQRNNAKSPKTTAIKKKKSGSKHTKRYHAPTSHLPLKRQEYVQTLP